MMLTYVVFVYLQHLSCVCPSVDPTFHSQLNWVVGKLRCGTVPAPAVYPPVVQRHSTFTCIFIAYSDSGIIRDLCLTTNIKNRLKMVVPNRIRSSSC